MKKNKFVSLGINVAFDSFDKSRFYINYSKFIIQEVGGFLGAILEIFNDGNPLVSNHNNEKNRFIKMQNNNFKSIKKRLSLLGQSEFCAWATKELDENKKFAYGFYSLIESGEIKENENLELLKTAICNSLKRNNFKTDCNKLYPDNYKEFVRFSNYNDEHIIINLQNKNHEDKNRFKLK